MKIIVGAVAAFVMFVAVIATTTIGPVAWSATASQPSPEALADIPADHLALYQQAATVCPGLDWSVLAAIGKIESDHGRSTLPGVANGTVNTAGAGGEMQFLQASFGAVVARHTIPPGGANPPSRWNAHDAIYAAAYYLCDSGADRGDLRTAVFAYNHDNTYVAQVLDQAGRYATALTPSAGAEQAIAFAQIQVGQPYLWGGDGPAQGENGWDCSGLTKAAYATAGISIPRVAQDQYNAGPHVPAGQPVQPGDLVFYGDSPTTITHVGIAVSSTQMINAPYTGAVVRIDPIARAGFIGTTRPVDLPPNPQPNRG